MNDLRPESREIAELLAGSVHGMPRADDELLSSLELAWLLHRVEVQYGVDVELGDEQLAEMSTVSRAATVLADVIAGARDG